MTESDNEQHVGKTELVNPDTTAAILQATFEHYYKMAMDHHTKAATTSNILLIIVGAIIALVGLDQKVCGVVDFGGAFAVFAIGLFGAVWARKQHERYYYWQHIAYEYQKELTEIVPMLKTGYEYNDGAQEAATKEFGSLFARRILDRHLWVSLHGIVAVIGLGLLAVSTRYLTC